MQNRSGCFQNYLPVVNLFHFERRTGRVAQTLGSALLFELELTFLQGGRVNVGFLRDAEDNSTRKTTQRSWCHYMTTFTRGVTHQIRRTPSHLVQRELRSSQNTTKQNSFERDATLEHFARCDARNNSKEAISKLKAASILYRQTSANVANQPIRVAVPHASKIP